MLCRYETVFKAITLDSCLRRLLHGGVACRRFIRHFTRPGSVESDIFCPLPMGDPAVLPWPFIGLSFPDDVLARLPSVV